MFLCVWTILTKVKLEVFLCTAIVNRTFKIYFKTWIQHDNTT
eukprot:UN12339